ncbi:SDR family oxidoreductase [Streptomyces sp. S.PB5]|uniref:SDR family NAD(P)-dependent oxidoreductase n=1 Tax=Streptomyces sp. S.PB5 TaxID=3020844 RepID=UPI0025AF946C|nr:SDR family oxidoreductase [Streptomyces sp. S.PB5]MDN3028104.1 SDR family oxidoreductase [Streptomyces sp. S.PB5]
MSAETTRLAGDVAVVTGSGNGLGAVIAGRLHRGGHRVVVADINADAAGAVAKELDETGATAMAVRTDVADGTAVQQLLEQVVQTWGPVRVLVNNAARTQAKELLEITREELDAVMSVNFGGTFTACQVFGAHMGDEGYGRIVNIASLAGQNGGTSTGGHYASSKGAVMAATKVFARELASRGVTVNAVSPGPQDLPVVHQIVGTDNLVSFVRSIPVGRLGSSGFIAEMVALLASPDAASVTGACWDANGGLFMR